MLFTGVNSQFLVWNQFVSIVKSLHQYPQRNYFKSNQYLRNDFSYVNEKQMKLKMYLLYFIKSMIYKCSLILGYG